MAGQLSLWGGRKQRGIAAATPTERALHFQTAQVLRRWKTAGWRVTHFPAGEWRNIVTARRLKAMGLEQGWADFLLLPPAPDLRLHQLELKRKGNRLSPPQLDMQNFCFVNGYPYAVCFSLDEVLDTLKSWGAVRATVSA